MCKALSISINYDARTKHMMQLMKHAQKKHKFFKQKESGKYISLFVYYINLKSLQVPVNKKSDSDFIEKLVHIIEENISNESFGVSELANEIGMSRSNLLRKIKSFTELSASQFIRQIRLKNAKGILEQSDITVSEVAYEVGFGSVSYFIKCFREYYGYPPGETNNQEDTKVSEKDEEAVLLEKQPVKNKKGIVIIASLFILFIFLFLFVWLPINEKNIQIDKSIAVLPFKNNSDDSSNEHIINGLMESILNNLQKIEDLRVISRTSVEKYRNTNKTIPEIAEELNVSYFIEGSGQKNGDEILLNIQLVNSSTDKQIWSEQYNRKVNDLFKLQQEVAKKIAKEIKVIIDPKAEEQINKIPTENLLAYEFYLKGLDYFYKQNTDDLHRAVTFYEKALTEDPEFALAYAELAITYSFLDLFQTKKKYTYLINVNADKALLYDPKLPESMVAKASYYLNVGEYKQALPHLEKALEHNPNSALVINLLANYYVNYMPNTEQYLKYALKGVSLDIASNDSMTTSYIYLHLANAFLQSGFIHEAEVNINKSLQYNPNNFYSQYVKPYIVFAKNKNMQETIKGLQKVYLQDTNRLELMQELGKLYYQDGNIPEAFKYYLRFNNIRKAQNLNIYLHENLKIALVYDEMGYTQEAQELLKSFKDFAETDQSIYKHAYLAGYYSYTGDFKKSIDHLKLFAQENNYHLWIVLFFDIDPVMANVKNKPEFKKALEQIRTKFWNKHKQIKATLEGQGLL